MTRAQEAPPFDAEALEALDRLRPHLARSAVVATRLGLAKAAGKVKALESLGLAAAVLQRDGRVLVTNALIEEFRSDLTWLARDRIALRDPIAQQTLSQALQAAEREPRARSFILRRSDPAPPAVAHLMPICLEARDLFASGSALLYITTGRKGRNVDAEIIRALFDLTPGEARVAVRLLEGDNIAAITQRGGVSVETVRSQVQSLFSKTGHSRQGELISSLAFLLRF